MLRQEGIARSLLVLLLTSLLVAVIVTTSFAEDDKLSSNIPHPPELVEFVSDTTGESLETSTLLLDDIAKEGDAIDRIRNNAPAYFAGSWIDPKTFKPVVAVRSEYAKPLIALELRESGYFGSFSTVKRSRSLAELREAARAVEASLTRIPEVLNGSPTSTSINEVEGRIDVKVPASLSSARFEKVRERIEDFGWPTSVRSVSDSELVHPPTVCDFPNCDRPLRAGTGISGPGFNSNCTGGFFAKSTNYRYYITAGHCRDSASNGTTYYAKSPSYYNPSTFGRSWSIGNNLTSLTSVGPYDYMAIRINSSSFWWANTPGGYYSDWGSNAILVSYPSARNPQYGEPTCRYGISSIYACGTVTIPSVNATVGPYKGAYYTVVGAIITNACATGGDSGGPFLGAGRVLFGIAAGGTQCSTNPGQSSSGSSTVQPALSALTAMGLTLVSGP